MFIVEEVFHSDWVPGGEWVPVKVRLCEKYEFVGHALAIFDTYGKAGRIMVEHIKTCEDMGMKVKCRVRSIVE